MSLTSAPFGFSAAYHPSGQIRSIAHPGILLAGTNVNIYKGQPVYLGIGTGAAINGVTVPAGQVYLAPVTATTQAIWGVFAGCEYFDATNKPTESNYWPASQPIYANTVVTAWLWEDPEMVYSAQLDGALTVGSPVGPYAYFDGRETNVSNFGNGSAQTGLSQCTLSATPVATTVQGQFQLLKIDPTILNQTPADTYPVFQVRIARSQILAPAVSI